MKKNLQNKKETVKTVNPAIETKKEEKRLTEINLSKFANQLSNVELKVKREKETIYVYPDGWTKEKINSDEGKKFRNKLRNRLKSFSNNIFYYAKTENQDSLKKEIDSFESFYKAHYRINDYSISSITNSEKKEKDIELMIMIIKEVKGQK